MNLDSLRSAADLSATKPHGTRLKYMGGCKCMLCRAANSRFETERAVARKNGDWNGIVDARAARRHILKLSKAGVGYKSVADAASVPTPSLRRSGQAGSSASGRGPSAASSPSPRPLMQPGR